MNDTFYITGGTLPQDASSYVTRHADTALLEGLRRGEFCYVLNTRQMGKSSLMVRAATQLKAEGCRVAILDLTAVAVEGGWLRVRNRVYAQVFDKPWALSHMPDAELRRQKRAYQRGLLRAASLASVILSLMAVLAGTALIERNHARAFADQLERAASENSILYKQSEYALKNAVAEKGRANEQTQLATPHALEAARQAHRAQEGQERERQLRKEADQLKSIADHHADRANRSADEAVRAEIKAQATARENRQQQILIRSRLSRADVETAAHLTSAGDVTAALAPLAEAMTLDKDEPARLAMHRRRFAATLASAPRLEHVWFADKPLRWGAYSPDRKWVAAAGEDGRARIWNVATGALLPLDIHHEGAIGYAAFSPDGTRLVTCGSDCCARVWDLKACRLLCTLRHPKRKDKRHDVIYASWSRDGKRLATAYCSLIVVWDVSAMGMSTATAMEPNGVQADNGVKILLNNKFEGARPNAVVLSPDGGRVAEISGNFLGWATDVASGQPRFAIVSYELQSCYNGRNAAFSANGRLLLVAGTFGWQGRNCGVGVFDGQVNVGERGGKTLLPLLRHSGAANYAAFSLDEKYIVTASDDHTARVWDARTGLPLCAPLRHAGAVVAAQFGSDARQVFTVSQDGTARVWSLPPAELPSPQAADGQYDFYYFASANKMFLDSASAAGAGAYRYHVLDLASLKPLYSLPVEEKSFSEFSPSADGHRIAFIGKSIGKSKGDVKGNVQVWDVALWKPITELLQADSAVLSHNYRLLMLRNKDNQVCLVDVQTGQVRQRFYSTIEVNLYTSYPFSPDDHSLAFCDADNSVCLRDTRTGRALTPPMPHDAPVTQACFSPDGRYLFTYTILKTLHVWNVATGTPAFPSLRDHEPLSDSSLFFTQDGRYAFTQASNDTLQWKLDGSATLSARRLDIRFLDMRFKFPISSPDGKMVIFKEQEKWLWEVTTLSNRTPTLDHGMKVTEAMFSPDSRRVLTIYAGGTARLWNVRTGEALTPLLTDDQIFTAAFSRDGRLLATGSDDGSVRVWDAQTGESLGPRLHLEGRIFQLEFSADARRLIAACNAEVHIWELPNSADSLTCMQARAQLLSGQRVDANVGFLPVSASALRAAWKTVQPLNPH